MENNHAQMAYFSRFFSQYFQLLTFQSKNALFLEDCEWWRISFHYYNFDWDHIDSLQPEWKSPQNEFLYKLSSFHICLQVKSRLHNFFFFYTLCKLFLNLKSGSSSKFKQRRLSIRFESMSSFKTPIRGKTFLSDSQRRVFKRLLSYSGDILQDLKQHFSALCSLKDVSSNPDTIQSSRPETSRNN